MDVAATWEPIDSLTPHPKNPRHNDGAVDDVAESIRTFGFGSPIIARAADRVIIAGHTRWKAAQALGMDKVPVRFMDLDPARAVALMLADNKLGELAGWDDALLSELAAEHDLDLTALGWSDEEAAGLLGGEDVKEEGEEQEVPDRWEVLVIVSGEFEQAKAIEWIEQGGFKCQPLIS